MSSNAIEAVGLSKKFRVPTERRTSVKERFTRGRAPAPNEFWALRDATFSVPKGSSLGLIGHNGSGKSTALKVLTGIYRPTSGHVVVNGSVSALLEVGAGFHPELTGRENIRLNATILGFTSREIDRLMDRIIEFADIGDHIDAPIKHYSSGMYVRLGFAVAVMVRPEILLVDEVIAVGDEEFQRKCYEYLFDLRRSGTSMIVVSHGLAQITDLCDEAVWLERGEVRGFGPSRAVVRAYVDEVNRRETGRSVRDESAEAEMIQRRGSGQIRVTAVALDVPGSKTGQVLRQGGKGRVRLDYLASSRVDDVRFEIGIRNAEGIPVAVLNSESIGSRRIAPGPAYVEFSADEILLAPGPHTLSTVVKSGAHVVDAIDDQFAFTVQSTGQDYGGTYRQPGRWRDPVRSFPPGGLDERPIIFVTGCPHSGATLFATILGCSPSTDLIPRETGWFTHGMSGDEILADLADCHRVPVEKTPNHVFHAESIQAAFPNARIVVVVRHPLDTVSSLLVRFGDLSQALTEYVLYTQRIIDLIEEDLGPIVVRLEDLLEDLEGVLKTLSPALGIEYSPRMLRFHQGSPAWFGVEPAEVPDQDGPDHARLRAWQVRQPLFDHRGRWRENLAGDDLVEVVSQTAELARAFGYDLDQSVGDE